MRAAAAARAQGSGSGTLRGHEKQRDHINLLAGGLARQCFDASSLGRELAGEARVGLRFGDGAQYLGRLSRLAADGERKR